MKTTAFSDATEAKLHEKEEELQEAVQRLKELECSCAEIKSSLEEKKAFVIELEDEKQTATLGQNKVSIRNLMLSQLATTKI